MPLPFAFALILVGLLLMAAELVLFSHGVLAMLGLSGMLVGTILVFGQDPGLGLATLVVLALLLPVLGHTLLEVWQNSAAGRRMVLQAPTDAMPLTQLAVLRELEGLRGKYGKTLSALRPSGTTDFDGRRVDTFSEGSLIEPGHWVRCVEVREGKVIVREVPGPPGPADLENLELP